MTTPIDELLERWENHPDLIRSDHLGYTAGILAQAAREFRAVWTATRAQMVPREQAEALAEGLHALLNADPSPDASQELYIALCHQYAAAREGAEQALATFRAKHP